jgi:hypothetical protein
MMGTYTWDAEGLAELRTLKRSGKPWNVIAEQLGRTAGACKARWAIMEGKKARYTRPASPDAPRRTMAFEIPPFRRNDDEKHLRLMLAALKQGRAA